MRASPFSYDHLTPHYHADNAARLAVLVILQFFPKFSNVSPALAALPLLVVLAITALKDAYEDLKRHQSDIHINNLPVRSDSDNGHMPLRPNRFVLHHVK